MKLRLKLALIAIFVIPYYSFAQSNFNAGYIVTPKGDTIKGFIDYHAWDINPTDFKFKPGTDSKSQKIDITSAIAVGIYGLDYFERSVVSISTDQVEISRISTGMDTSKIINTVFLRLLTKGKHVDLYSYTDEIKTRYYYKETDIGGVHEFIHHIFYPQGNTTSFVEATSENQLLYLANKYNPAAASLVHGTGYTKPELLRIIFLINGDKENNHKQPISKSTAFFFVGTGASASVMQFRNYPVFDNPDYNKSYLFPYITAGIDFYPNKITQKLLIKFQLSVVPDQHDIYSSIRQNTTTTTETTLQFKQYNLGLMPQIIYNFYSRKDLKVYGGTGASINIPYYKDYKYIVHFNDGYNNTTNVTQLIRFDDLWFAVPITAGVVINDHIDLNLFYFVPSTFTNYGGITSNVTSYRLGINYLF